LRRWKIEGVIPAIEYCLSKSKELDVQMLDRRLGGWAAGTPEWLE